MIKSKNRIELRGNLGADPELRVLPSGGEVATFSMATEDSWKDRNDVWHSRTDWHLIEVWGRDIEEVMTYKKGDMVDVEGKSRNDRVPDENSNGYRNYPKVRAISVIRIQRPAPRVGSEDDDATDVNGSAVDERHAAWLAEYDNATVAGCRNTFS